MDKSHLKNACEFAIKLARHNRNEKIKEVKIPAKLDKYLDLEKLNKKSVENVAEILDKNEEFRKYVGNNTNQIQVGRIGYLWLTRPQGWENDLHDPISNSEDYRVTSNTIPSNKLGGDLVQETDLSQINDNPPIPNNEFAMGNNGQDSDQNNYRSNGSSGIKDELSSLRGLVDSLASEREMVSQSYESPANSGQINKQLEEEVLLLRQQITELENQIDSRSDNNPKESRQLSLSLSRQVQLEKDLAELRDLRLDLESKLSDAQVALKDHEDRIARAEALRTDAEDELSQMKSQVNSLLSERDNLKEEHTAMKIECDAASKKLADIDRLAGGVDIATLQKDNKALAASAFEAESELAKYKSSSQQFEIELQEQKQMVASLQSENSDLTNRMHSIEDLYSKSSVELDEKQQEIVEYIQQNEVQADQLQDFRSQIEDLQSSLSDALDDLGRVRSEGDADRESFRAVRQERDNLISKIAEFEDKDKRNNKLILEISKDRDELKSKQEELLNERGNLRGEIASSQREFDQLNNRLRILQENTESLEKEIRDNNKIIDGLKSQLADSSNNKRISKDYEDKISAVKSKYESEVDQLRSYINELESQISDIRSESRVSAQLPEQNKPVAERPSLGDFSNSSSKDTPANVSELINKAEAKQKNTNKQAPLPTSNVKNIETNSSDDVWSHDWPPGSEDVFEEFASDMNIGSPNGFEHHPSSLVDDFGDTPTNNDLDDEDIEKISELLSQTVTDFQAITDIPDMPDSTYSVSDSNSDAWTDNFSGNSGEFDLENQIEKLKASVSQRDTVLLVDGDAVAQMGWSRLSIVERRNSLVSFLAHISEQFGVAIQVVFDEKIAGKNSLPHSRLVRIRLSQLAESTSGVLSELLASFPDNWPKVVVSDDRDTVNSAVKMNAEVYENEILLDFINMIAAS